MNVTYIRFTLISHKLYHITVQCKMVQPKLSAVFSKISTFTQNLGSRLVVTVLLCNVDLKKMKRSLKYILKAS
jgi:hypothetical protein